jgi:hypothetical protein
MNLLKDKREQERTGEFQDFPNFPLDDFNQGGSLQAPLNKDKNRRRSSFLTPLITVVVILGIAAAGYYFGFYKPKQRAELPKQVVAVDDAKPSVEASPPIEKPTATTEQPAPAEQPVVVETPQTSLGMAAKILAALNNVVKESVRIGSVFMDEGSFSAEVTAGSPESAKSIYDVLLHSIPAGLAITSLPPSAGTGILLSGTFNTAGGGVAAEQLSGADLEGKMRALAQQNGMTLTTATVSTQAPRQLFIKMSGAISGCQTFLEMLAKENLKLTVSKIILMPGQAGEYTFVLRLLI